MTEGRSVKTRQNRAALVAVIASVADLSRATRLRRLPDFFEVRLDALYPLSPAVERTIAKLARPLIVTARHPQEGGHNHLSAAQRRQLLLRFLPLAAFVDVELRSAAQLRAVLEAAAKRKTKRIISVHELRRTPSQREMERLFRGAQGHSAEVFKIVTRSETAEDLARLVTFFDNQKGRVPLSAMGIGKLGRASRVTLMRRGSVLNYAHLGTRQIEGQFSLIEMRRHAAGAR
jgi:3-dehydroquinate dehydratase I